jgi:hypothetical protein
MSEGVAPIGRGAVRFRHLARGCALAATRALPFAGHASG